MTSPDPPRLFGAEISRLTRGELVAAMSAAAPEPGSGVRLVVTMNLDHVVQLQNNAAFRAAYANAWAVTLDGTPVALWSRVRGLRRPKVTGADLLADLVPALRPGRHRPFFVVSSPEVGARLAARLQGQGFAAADIGAASPPLGFEADAAASQALVRAIRAHRPTHLIFGLGAPKSEVWIDARRGELGDLYALACGSAPDFLVGAAKRAPRPLQRAGLEWAWRVAQDPKRLWRRYFVNSWAFLPAAVRDLRTRGELA